MYRHWWHLSSYVVSDSSILTKCSSPHLISGGEVEYLMVSVVLEEDVWHEMEPYSNSWSGSRGTLRPKSLSSGLTVYNVLCSQLHSLSDLIKLARKEYQGFLFMSYPDSGFLTYHTVILKIFKIKVCQIILFFLSKRCICSTKGHFYSLIGK